MKFLCFLVLLGAPASRWGAEAQLLAAEDAFDSISNGVYKISITNRLGALCAGGGEIATTWEGAECGNGKILWNNMYTASKNCGMDGSWRRAGKSAHWLSEWLGECGISPTMVTLPTRANTVKFSLQHKHPALCGHGGGCNAISTTWYGIPCASNHLQVEWQYMHTTKTQSSTTDTSQLVWKRGDWGTPAKDVYWLGECGVQAAEVPLPLYMDFVSYTKKSHTVSAICSSGAPTDSVWVGHFCDASHTAIEWDVISTPMPTSSFWACQGHFITWERSDWSSTGAAQWVGSCGVAPSYSEVADVPFSSNSGTPPSDPPAPDFITKTKLAMVLSKLVYESNPGASKAQFESNYGFTASIFHWHSQTSPAPDTAIVAKIGPICYGAFQGTESAIEDWAQNLASPPIATSNIHGCNVHAGFYSAYHTSYRTSFEANLAACVATCTSGACKVLLTGHSQGGAAAVVASMRLKNLYNPEVITFGAPETAAGGCSAIDSSKHFRFQAFHYIGNIIDNWRYDPIPNIDVPGMVHYGNTYLLNGDSTRINVLGTGLRMPTDLVLGWKPHRSNTYLSWTQALSSTANIGHSSWANGKKCFHSDECESGRCAGVILNSAGTCQSKLGSCSPCTANSDCHSNRCNVLGCAEAHSGKLKNGCGCLLPTDCEGGACDLINGCFSLKSNGASCILGSECQSGTCAGFKCCTPGPFLTCNI